MGATTCPSCSKPYAPHREDCPHCGADNPTIATERTGAEVDARVRESARLAAERATSGASAISGEPAPPTSPSGVSGTVVALLLVLAVGFGASGTWCLARYRPADASAQTPVPLPIAPEAPRAPRAVPDPFPYGDEARVTAEARVLLEANYDEPHGGHILQNMRGRYPNEPEKAVEAALEYFRVGIRNRWRLASRVVERARELGFGDEAALEALRGERLSQFMGPDMFSRITPEEFERKVVGPNGVLDHQDGTSGVIDQELRRAAQKVEAMRRIRGK